MKFNSDHKQQIQSKCYLITRVCVICLISKLQSQILEVLTQSKFAKKCLILKKKVFFTNNMFYFYTDMVLLEKTHQGPSSEVKLNAQTVKKRERFSVIKMTMIYISYLLIFYTVYFSGTTQGNNVYAFFIILFTLIDLHK